jgi:hypothetical protein
VVSYECEAWCLALREEHRLRVFENRELRRIFGPKRVVLEQPQLNATRKEWMRSFKMTGV